MPTKLDTLRARAAELRTQIDANRTRGTEILSEKTPTSEQLGELQTLTERGASDRALLDQVDNQIREEEAAEARTAQTRAAQVDAGTTPGGREVGGAVVTAEPTVYGRGSRSSYFLDLARSDLNRGDGDGGVQSARERLAQHAKQVSVDMPKREARRAQAAGREMRDRFGADAGFEQRVNPNRTDGQGGYFVPPLWLVDEYVALQRAGRVIANSVRNMTLPGGTDSVNVPKVATGTVTGVQTADAAAVSSTDLTDTSITAPVRTIAGQQDIAMQLLDQSPVSFDEIVFADLMADLNQKLDVQVISGSGLSGQATGIYNVSSIIGVSYTDASPTGPELYPSLAGAISQMASTRYLPPTAIFMHPRRWYWLASQLDNSNRPLVTPAQAADFNALALQTGVNAEGPAGYILGLPVLLDPNIQTTVSTNQDVIYVLRTPDIYLWEGSVRSRTLTEVLSGTLQVRLQVWEYFALLANRYASSIATVTGTGLVAPSGF